MEEIKDTMICLSIYLFIVCEVAFNIVYIRQHKRKNWTAKGARIGAKNTDMPYYNGTLLYIINTLAKEGNACCPK